MFEYWITADLETLPIVTQMSGRVFHQDDGANKIGVRVYRKGKPAELTGTVTANVIRSNNSTIEVTGELDGNRAWVVLPTEAYAYVGRIGIYLKLTDDTVVTTLGGVETKVYPSAT